MQGARVAFQAARLRREQIPRAARALALAPLRRADARHGADVEKRRASERVRGSPAGAFPQILTFENR